MGALSYVVVNMEGQHRAFWSQADASIGLYNHNDIDWCLVYAEAYVYATNVVHTLGRYAKENYLCGKKRV